MDRNKGIWGIIACIFVVGLAVTFTTSNYITRQEETGQMETTAVLAAETEAVPSPGAGAARLGPAPGEDPAEADSGVLSGQEPGGSSIEGDAGAGDPEPDGPGAAGTQSPESDAASPDSGSAAETTGYALVEISPLEGPVSTKAAGDQADLKGYYLMRLNDLDAQIQKMRAEETDTTTYSMKNAAENELKLWDNELNTIYSVILKQMDETDSKKLVDEERAWMKERDSQATDAAQKYSGGSIEGLEYTASLAESTKSRAYELVETYFDD